MTTLVQYFLKRCDKQRSNTNHQLLMALAVSCRMTLCVRGFAYWGKGDIGKTWIRHLCAWDPIKTPQVRRERNISFLLWLLARPGHTVRTKIHLEKKKRPLVYDLIQGFHFYQGFPDSPTRHRILSQLKHLHNVQWPTLNIWVQSGLKDGTTHSPKGKDNN